MGFGRAAIAVDADGSVLELNGFCSVWRKLLTALFGRRRPYSLSGAIPVDLLSEIINNVARVF